MAEIQRNKNKGMFPSQSVPFAEKSSMKYGEEVGSAIEAQWFEREGGTPHYFQNRQSFHRLRLYARGEQPIQKYKDELAINGDTSYLNISWKNIPIIPKFVDIVVNGIDGRAYDVKAYAQDPTSLKKKSDHVKDLISDMRNKEMLNVIAEQFGLNMYKTNPNDLPQNDEELQLRVQLDLKEEIEIAEEVAINNVLDHNKYELIKRRCDYDITTIGIACTRHRFSTSEGIVIDYVDPADMVWSLTDDPYFNDLYYVGEIRRISITELKKQYPHLNSEDIKKIEEATTGQLKFARRGANDAVDTNHVYVLYWEYKTWYDQVFKIKKTETGGEKVIQKEDTWDAEPNEYFDVERRTIETVFCGAKVIGVDVMLEWKEAENLVRPKSDTTKTSLSYNLVAPHMYRGKIESLVNRMTTFADAVQLTHLKLQQVMSRINPDGIFIDADGLAEIDLGNGTVYNAQEAINMYFQTGSIVGRSLTQDGEFNNGRVPIQELTSSDPTRKMNALIMHYNTQLNMIRDVTGLNEAVDGSKPEKDALVGVMKLAAANSNTATRHIFYGGLYLTTKTVEGISLRISDVLENPNTKESFIQSIGKYNVATLESISDLHLHDFGIYIELAPDEEEKQMLEANIQQALAKDQIDLEDAIDVRQIKNIKLANQLLKLRRRKRDEKLRQQQLENIQAQAQANAQATQAQAQAEYQKEAALSGVRMSEEKQKAMIEAEKMKAEAEIKKGLMLYEFQLNMQLKEKELQVIKGTEKEREDRKDQRTRIQATQQSELIEQRKGNTGTKNFESKGNDTLDGFGIENFEPR